MPARRCFQVICKENCCKVVKKVMAKDNTKFRNFSHTSRGCVLGSCSKKF